MVTAQEPQYPEFAELRGEAERRSRGFVNPSDVRAGGRYDQVFYRRGYDWCVAVLGGAFPGVPRITHFEAELLVVADERNVDPPLPQSVVESRARAAARQDADTVWRKLIASRDEAAWRAALEAAAAGVELQVFTNVKARPRHGVAHYLGHAVPAVDVYSGRGRTHHAGAALCESPGRANPLQLESEPSDVPATCKRCLAWIPKVRPTRWAAPPPL